MAPLTWLECSDLFHAKYFQYFCDFLVKCGKNQQMGCVTNCSPSCTHATIEACQPQCLKYCNCKEGYAFTNEFSGECIPFHECPETEFFERSK